MTIKHLQALSPEEHWILERALTDFWYSYTKYAEGTHEEEVYDSLITKLKPILQKEQTL